MQNEQINIKADLYDFEKKYGISTKDFYTQYKAGKKGDDEDTLIWAGIYEMFLENMQKLSEIQYEVSNLLIIKQFLYLC